jgi:hypothetical protein
VVASGCEHLRNTLYWLTTQLTQRTFNYEARFLSIPSRHFRCNFVDGFAMVDIDSKADIDIALVVICGRTFDLHSLIAHPSHNGQTCAQA